MSWSALRLACVVGLVACSGSEAPHVGPTDDASPTGDEDGAAPDGGSRDGGTRADSGGIRDGGPEEGGSPGFAVRVDGNRLLDGAGTPLRLVGVDHSGSEYACVQGYGIFDSPHDDALAAAMASWHVNAVRVPLNEDCWLAINGVKPQYAGATYQAAIADWVKTLHAHGMYAILELHWSAPGASSATGQQPMADADHSNDLWSGVAAAFKDDPAAIFDLYNEPYVSALNAATLDPWACWRDGCTIRASGAITADWRSTGMQPLLDAVRNAGAKNVVMAGGLAYSNDLSGWLAHAPSDPLGQLAASFHLYNFTGCKTSTCWDSQVAPVAEKVPVITGEIGENDCGHDFIDGYMSWADAHAISYLGWTFNPWDCSTGPALVVDFAGTPTGFGRGFRDHVLTLFP